MLTLLLILWPSSNLLSMGRHLLAAAVVVADTALLVAMHRGGPPFWAISGYALAAALVVVLRYRIPMAAFALAIALASLTGGGYALLIWVSYQAGREIVSRLGTVVVVGAALGGLAVQFASPGANQRAIPNLVSTYVVFVALPLLAGRYLAQHERLVSALDQHNRQLRWKREFLAEQERLHERLRIARDMHDSLGHRLSLVSVQAAALEVSALPPRQREAVGQLARAARGALDELYELVGALRGGDEAQERSPGVEAIGTVVEEFQAAGVPVTLRQHGQPHPISAAAGRAAYRVVEEGLTNAAKHAPGQPVTVNVEWEPDALLLAVVNPVVVSPVVVSPVVVSPVVVSPVVVSPVVVSPVVADPVVADLVPAGPAVAGGTDGGHGLSGLAERVQPVGGFLDHRRSDDRFRLLAMLPVEAEETPLDTDPAAVGRMGMAAVGFATAALIFVVVPLSMLLGVR
jgi:signal transduction histidine kinase